MTEVIIIGGGIGGAVAGMEDAVVLAQCLRDLPSSWWRPARMGGRAAPGFVKRVVRDLMPPRILANRPRNANTWLTSHHIGWPATPRACPPGCLIK